ncbi:MAG: manganese-binding transcriptional regulator MntR [Halofilum sp. (in: g-proteobacteria)]|nr:manganese-binding transcriptional regulator MntR [Halofilum sp. (in: g-proteobacteria)]
MSRDRGPTRPAGDQPHMPAPDEHARQHASVRHAHETELVEDYVELVADLIDSKGEARAVDLAHRFGVAQATVAKMLRRLDERGLVVREPYRNILLTDAGRALAEQSRRRHALVLEFLLTLGVDDAIARRDAEGIEHHVSEDTLEAMRRFVEREGKK